VYRWVEHTAELELAIEAPDARGVLAGAVAALCELLEPGSPADLEERTVSVRAGDRAALLAAWLEELVYLAESEGFVACSLGEARLSPDALETTVSGRLAEPRPIIKAVTYHRLTFESRGDGYAASVVFDV